MIECRLCYQNRARNKFQVGGYDPCDAISMIDHLITVHRASSLRGRSMVYLLMQGLVIDASQRPKEETR